MNITFEVVYYDDFRILRFTAHGEETPSGDPIEFYIDLAHLDASRDTKAFLANINPE